MYEMVAAEVESSAPPKWKEVMEKSFARMDSEVVAGPGGGTENPNCRCELQTPKCDHVGSTAVVAVVSSDHIVVANCGDSRAVLGRKGAAVPLSVDHKVITRSDFSNSMRERRRIEFICTNFLVDFCSQIDQTNCSGSRMLAGA